MKSIFQHKYILVLMVLILGLIIWASVTTIISKKVTCNGFSMVVVMAQPFESNSSTNIPPDIAEFYNIVLSCNDSVAFYPNSNSGIACLGMQGSKDNFFNISVLKTQPEKVVREKNLEGEIAGEIDSYLRNKKLPQTYFTSSEHNSNAEVDLDSYLAEVKGSILIYIDYDNKITKFETNGETFPVYHKLSLVKAARDSMLCNNESRIILLYNPLIRKKVTDPEFVDITDIEYDSLKSVISIKENKPLAFDSLNQGLNGYYDDSDWRVYYLKAENNIFGKKHIKAFQALIEAARVAIATGKRVDMLGEMEQDENGVMWKLATHDIWDFVAEALEDNDPASLDLIDLIGEAKEHDEELTPIDHHNHPKL